MFLLQKTAPNITPRTLDIKATKSSRIKSVHLRVRISSVLGSDKNSADEVSTIQSSASFREDNDLSGFSIMEFENDDDDEEKENNSSPRMMNYNIEGDILDEEETLAIAKQTKAENERLKAELEEIKLNAKKEKALAARKLAELEDEVDRLQSESMARQSIDSSYSIGGGGGGQIKMRMNSLVAEVNSNVFELSTAANKASKLPPVAVVGQWITVEGKGLGKVLSFHKEWTPGTDSKRNVLSRMF